MQKVKLKEVCTLINGRAYKQEELLDSGKYPVLRVGNFFSDKDYYYSDLELEEDKYCDSGDLLFAWSASFGPKIWNGGKVIYHYHIWKMVLEDTVNKEYLYYYLYYLSERIKAEGHGGIMIHTTKAEMEERELSLPDMSKQCEIAKVLNQLSAIIEKRQTEIKELDNLIKARFVELFGDPETNPLGWEQMTLNDVCSSVVRGPFGSALKKEFFVEPGENTYKVYEQKHAIQKSAEIGTYYISEEKYNELKRFECLPGDILMSCSGTMGELYQLPEGCAKGVINQALCKFTLNEKILPVCFLEYMRQTIGNLETKGSGIQNIAAVSYVKAMPINVPTMDVQRQFVSFVEQVDKSKVLIQKSLNEIQILFDKLMQDCFG